ncbi:hypothetical protein KDL67_10435 [bacterium]|nr:hypothetical protein [bacterium]
MTALISLVSRVCFVLAFILVGVAVWEKIANLMGMTLLRGYTPSRLLELSMVLLMFVIAIQVRELKGAKGL